MNFEPFNILLIYNLILWYNFLIKKELEPVFKTLCCFTFCWNGELCKVSIKRVIITCIGTITFCNFASKVWHCSRKDYKKIKKLTLNREVR